MAICPIQPMQSKVKHCLFVPLGPFLPMSPRGPLRPGSPLLPGCPGKPLSPPGPGRPGGPGGPGNPEMPDSGLVRLAANWASCPVRKPDMAKP